MSERPKSSRVDPRRRLLHAPHQLLDRAGRPLRADDATGLAAEIVFGVLRRRAQLDFLIAHFGGRPAGR